MNPGPPLGSQRYINPQKAKPGPFPVRGSAGPAIKVNHRPAVMWTLMLPSLYRDVLSCRAGSGNRITMLAHAFEMKFDCLADQILCFVQCLGGDAEPGQVRSIGAPSGCGLFVDDEIFHFRPACLRILFNVPGGMSSDDVPRL